jgi:AcrR family transcriptional regulator
VTSGKPSRRDQILAAAAELFARSGFHGVGIDDIGAAVGISGPALYRHFRSKDAMLGEMLTSISEYLLTGGQRTVDANADAEQALAELIRFHVDFALDNPALITVQERSLGNLGEPDRRRVRGMQRRYVEVWVRTITATVPGVDEPGARAAAHAVFGLINSTPHSAHLDRDQMAGLLYRMARSALVSPGSLVVSAGRSATMGARGADHVADTGVKAEESEREVSA